MRIQRTIAIALGGMIAGTLSVGMVGIADAQLVAHWALDDGQTDPNTFTAIDAIAPAADGVWDQGGSELGPIPRWVDGALGGAAEFGGQGGTGAGPAGPGTGDVITIPGDGKLDITGALTLAAWIRYEEMEGGISTRHIAGKDRGGGASQDAYSLKHNMAGSEDTLQFLIASGGVNNNLTSERTFSEYTAESQRGGWIHMTGVFEPGQFMRLYIDGELDAEMTVGAPFAIDSFPGTPFNIGRLHNSNTHSFNGGIDDVRVYNSALTLEEIESLVAMVPPVDPGGDGDFDGDGIVDGHDFLYWQRNTAAGNLSDWESNFGGGGGGEFSAIPEPSALVLMFTAACGLAGLGRNRRDAEIVGRNE